MSQMKRGRKTKPKLPILLQPSQKTLQMELSAKQQALELWGLDVNNRNEGLIEEQETARDNGMKEEADLLFSYDLFGNSQQGQMPCEMLPFSDEEQSNEGNNEFLISLIGNTETKQNQRNIQNFQVQNTAVLLQQAQKKQKNKQKNKRKLQNLESIFCNCQKNYCLKNFCGCYANGRGCDYNCKCKNCANVDEQVSQK